MIEPTENFIERRKTERRQGNRRDVALSNQIQSSLKTYFKDLEGHAPGNLYDIVLNEIERPLLEVVLEHTDNNVTKAAELLGLNRGTLRKKLHKYHMGK